MYGTCIEALSAHRVECADNAANHFVKKATASYIYADTSTVLLEDNRFNFFYRIWIGIFCRHSGESGEIMLPNKMLTGCFHGRKIQRIVSTSPNCIRIKGVGTSSVEGVAVAFFASRVSGVEAVRYGTDAFNANACVENGVEGANQFFAVVRPIRIKMEALSSGVDARIGSATSVNANAAIKDAGKGGFDMVLNTAARRLGLPT